MPTAPRPPRRAARRSDERGVALPLFALLLLVFLGFSAFVVDIGMALVAKRQAQRAVDAAALAAAQELPSPAAAESRAIQYLARNPLTSSARTVGSRVDARCRADIPGCKPANAVNVTVRAEVPTRFAKFFGVDTWNIRVTGTACRPCSGRKADIVIVLDRTGSMASNKGILNAKPAILALIGAMDPDLHRIGFGVYPPSTTTDKCRVNTGALNGYGVANAPYNLVPLSDDYRIKGSGSVGSGGTSAVNGASELVRTVNCVRTDGRTAYAYSVDEAVKMLKDQGRPGVAQYIILLSDGGANIGPTGYVGAPPPQYLTNPCTTAIQRANAAKAQGITVYTVGYALGTEKCLMGIPANPGAMGTVVDNNLSAESTLRQMASSSQTFFLQPNEAQMESIFLQIAGDISGASLIEDDAGVTVLPPSEG